MHRRFLHTLRCTFHPVQSPATYTYHPHHEVGEQGNPESGQDECQHKALLPAWFAAVWNCGKQHKYQWPCQKPFNFVHFSICRTKERNSLAFLSLSQTVTALQAEQMIPEGCLQLCMSAHFPGYLSTILGFVTFSQVLHTRPESSYS